MTPDPALQAERALAAAEASLQAGAFDMVARLLATAEAGPLDGFQSARAALVRGRAALSSAYGNEAATLLFDAASRLESFDLGLARRAYLTAWSAAIVAHHLGGADVLREISRAVLALPPLPPDAHPLDLVLEAFALLTTDGHAAAMPSLRRAADDVLQLPVEDVLEWSFQVGVAHELFTSMGMQAFAERAGSELLATGEKVRRRIAETRDDLTPQERQVAQLARDGLSNSEIGARLFLSPRTIEWHLRHVFAKLGIRSRRQLGIALEASESGVAAG